jgi:hypothetical protein
MGKLQTPEEIKASKIEATAKYLKHAEEVLSELLGPLFGDGRIETTDDFTSMFMADAMGLRNLVMAMRRYPTFDPICLSSMKPFKFKRRVGTEDFVIDVMVPSFGVLAINHNMGFAEFDLVQERNTFQLGGDHSGVHFSFDLQMQNRQLMERHRINWQDAKLRARMPHIPKDVQRRIAEAQPCFDHMSIVWEAEWSNAPVVDPLILGHVMGKHFLVDQYDVTKLERYVSSEMTRPPIK